MRNLVEFLTEAISSGKCKDITPEYGCSIEEIVDWLRSRGIREIKKYNGELYYPEKGKLLAEVGPQNIGLNSHWVGFHWVGLTNSFRQCVTIRPETTSGFQNDGRERQTSITFDKALELMELMLDNPNKPVKL